MRTTIEIKDEHRAALLELAARRREKGFSTLVNEAIERYLAEAGEAAVRRNRAAALKGRLRESDARPLRRRVAAIRERWR